MGESPETNEIARLLGENKNWQIIADSFNSTIKDQYKCIVALARDFAKAQKDVERLDWLDQQGCGWDDFMHFCFPEGGAVQSIRDAIDNWRKAEESAEEPT